MLGDTLGLTERECPLHKIRCVGTKRYPVKSV